MTRPPDETWQQICTIEQPSLANWVLELVAGIVPEGRQLRLHEDRDGNLEILCSPPLSDEEMEAFEERFDDLNLVDVAY